MYTYHKMQFCGKLLRIFRQTNIFISLKVINKKQCKELLREMCCIGSWKKREEIKKKGS